MKVLLATIEHSGTRFTAALMGKRMYMLEREESWTEKDILYAHLTDKLMPLIRAASKRMPIITTRRDPELIRQSWMRTDRNTRGLEEQLRNYEELLTFRPKPAVMDLWGGFERLPPYFAWFKNPSPPEVDALLLEHPRFLM